MLERLEQIDKEITLMINGWNSPVTDPVMIFFSNIPVWIPMYVLIVAFMFWRYEWRKALFMLGAALLTFGFCDQFSNFIKDLTLRFRPLHDEWMVLNGLHILEGGGKFSFFSAHAANAFGLAITTLTCFRANEPLRTIKSDKKFSTYLERNMLKIYSYWMFFWATMVAISRIFVGKHFLGDVVVGIIVGLAAGYFFGSYANRCIRRWVA